MNARSFTHEIRIRHEEDRPYQWLGSCSCGKGTRRNSRADARRFFREQGCVNASEELAARVLVSDVSTQESQAERENLRAGEYGTGTDD